KVVLAPLGEMPQDGFHALVVDLARRDDDVPVLEGGFHVLAACAADAPGSHMDDLADPGHLGGPAHGAGIPPTLAAHFLPVVDVRVNLDDGDGAVPFVGEEGQGRSGVVAAQHDRHGAPVQDLLHRCGGPLAVALQIPGVCRYVSYVHDPHVGGQHFAVAIEVVMVAERAVAFGTLADGLGSSGRRGGKTLHGVGHAERYAHHGEVGLQAIQVGFHGTVKEACTSWGYG